MKQATLHTTRSMPARIPGGVRATARHFPRRDSVAIGICLLYGLALLAFHHYFHDGSLRVYDFLHHAAIARDLASGRIAVDGFYPLGYPALLAAGVALGANVFVVGKIISGVAAVAVLFCSYRLVLKLTDGIARDWAPFIAIGAIGLSATFVQHATTPNTDMIHIALLLASCLLVLEAFESPQPAPWLLAAGVVGGLSYLVRFTSLLILPAFAIWLALVSPWGRTVARRGGDYLLGFVVAASPQFILSAIQHGSPLYTTTLAKNIWVGNYAGALPELTWGQVADGVSLGAVIRADPGRFLLNWGFNIVGPTFWADVLALVNWGERIAGGGAMAATGPDSPAAVIPGLLKCVAACGAAMLVLRGADWVPDLGLKAGFLALFAVLFTAATALAFVTERHLLLVIPLLAILAAAALASLAERRWGVVIGVGTLALLLYHLTAMNYPDRWMLGYDHAVQTSAIIRAHGADPSVVYATNWGFYDYDSRWLAHYEHLPVEIATVEDLVATMRARGIRYLVYDRNGGTAQWPQLQPLLHPEQQPGGLQLIAAPIESRESPPNLVLIYSLP